MDDRVLEIYRKVLPEFDGPTPSGYEEAAHRLEQALQQVTWDPPAEAIQELLDEPEPKEPDLVAVEVVLEYNARMTAMIDVTVDRNSEDWGGLDAQVYDLAYERVSNESVVFEEFDCDEIVVAEWREVDNAP